MKKIIFYIGVAVMFFLVELITGLSIIHALVGAAVFGILYFIGMKYIFKHKLSNNEKITKP